MNEPIIFIRLTLYLNGKKEEIKLVFDFKKDISYLGISDIVCCDILINKNGPFDGFRRKKYFKYATIEFLNTTNVVLEDFNQKLFEVLETCECIYRIEYLDWGMNLIDSFQVDPGLSKKWFYKGYFNDGRFYLIQSSHY